MRSPPPRHPSAAVRTDDARHRVPAGPRAPVGEVHRTGAHVTRELLEGRWGRVKGRGLEASSCWLQRRRKGFSPHLDAQTGLHQMKLVHQLLVERSHVLGDHLLVHGEAILQDVRLRRKPISFPGKDLSPQAFAPQHPPAQT